MSEAGIVKGMLMSWVLGTVASVALCGPCVGVAFGEGGVTAVSPIFLLSELPGAPVISGEMTLSVGSVEAEVIAQINPQLATTTYFVQYGTDTSYGLGIAPGSGEVSLEASESPEQIRVAISGLLPGVSYHYRVTATNEFGSTLGSDHTFTTYSNTKAALPDQRAWEMVSPLDKNGGEIRGIVDAVNIGGIVQAAADGKAITYTSVSSFLTPLGAPIRSQYLAKRSPDSWDSENISSPTRALENAVVGAGGPYKAFSSDLSRGLQLAGRLPPPPEIPTGDLNFYLWDSVSGVFHGLITSPPHGAGETILGPGQYDLTLTGASPNLEHIVVQTRAALTNGATYTGQENLFEWSAGLFDAINILPGVTTGETVPGAELGTGEELASSAISEDGSRAFWKIPTDTAPLFVRKNIGTLQAATVQVDSSHGVGGSGSGEFQMASTDGSRVFFTDKKRLTEDSTAGSISTREDLYEFNVDTGVLTDLSVDANEADIDGASVKGMLGTSRDGSYVYFVAGGALPQAQQPNVQGQYPVSGGSNLYVANGGVVKYIATLASGNITEGNLDTLDWETKVFSRTARVTPDGTHVVFNSSQQLTGYDSDGLEEVYVYDAPTGVLVCASCSPSGAVPSGPSSIPPGTPNGLNKSLYQSRVISDDGHRIFFDSNDSLTPQDTNGRMDVYEFEDGKIYLISGGTSDSDSEFVDASVSGNDVFFITGQRLVPEDSDELFDLYDARVDGGIPRPLSPPVCSGAGCQGPPSAPPIFATPAAATFVGPGNVVAPKKVTRAKKKRKTKSKARRVKPSRGRARSPRGRAMGARAHREGRGKVMQ